MRKGVIATALVTAALALPVAANQAHAGVTVDVLETASAQKIVFRKRKKKDKIVIPDNPVDLHCEIYPENCAKN